MMDAHVDIIDVWCVHRGDDDRSSGHPAYFFTSEEAATKARKGTGWYGGDAPISKRKAIRVNDDCYLLDEIGEIDLDGAKEVHKRKTREKALSKLTEEERELLGLEDSDEDE